MCKVMSVQVAFSDEVLSARVAAEGSFASVGAEVRLEVSSLAKRFLAVDVRAEVDLL